MQWLALDHWATILHDSLKEDEVALLWPFRGRQSKNSLLARLFGALLCSSVTTSRE